MAHVYPAFDAYLGSVDAQSADAWQIDTLAAARFPGHRPTVETYVALRAALETVRHESQEFAAVSLG
jgi:hypothetical protein